MTDNDYFLEAEIILATPNFESGIVLCNFATRETVRFDVAEECFNHGKLGSELRNRNVFE